jgi:hypothetical protein
MFRAPCAHQDSGARSARSRRRSIILGSGAPRTGASRSPTAPAEKRKEKDPSFDRVGSGSGFREMLEEHGGEIMVLDGSIGLPWERKTDLSRSMAHGQVASTSAISACLLLEHEFIFNDCFIWHQRGIVFSLKKINH